MNLTDRFKRNNSECPPGPAWAKALLSRQGERELCNEAGFLKGFFRVSHRPGQWLSPVGLELYTIASLVKADDPVHPMATKALTEGCGLSYGALLDALVEDGVMTETEAVPSRFAALLLQNGLTGIEIDRVMDDWGATKSKVPPRALLRMEKALAQGVVVCETTATRWTRAGVQLRDKHKAVRVRPAGRVKAWTTPRPGVPAGAGLPCS